MMSKRDSSDADALVSDPAIVDAAVGSLEHTVKVAIAWLWDDDALARFSPAEVTSWKRALLQQVQAAEYNLRHALHPLFREIMYGDEEVH